MSSGIDLAFDGKLTKNSELSRQSMEDLSTVGVWNSIEVSQTNVLENVVQTTKLLENIDFEKVPLPRPDPRVLGARSKLRTPWKIKLSVFRDY